jgi:hypothetical protein
MTAGKSRKGSEAEHYVSPARASQILSHTLGHGYSRQSIVRLLESGALMGHQMTPRGRWWILSSSLRVYAQSILKQDAGECYGSSDVAVAQLVTVASNSQRPM